jgi:putative DNA primase/helicase
MGGIDTGNVVPFNASLEAKPSLLQFDQNDAGNSARLIATHGDDMRYCHDMRRWLVWNGSKWVIDRSQTVYMWAKETMNAYHREALERGVKDHENFARRSLDSHRIRSLVELTQCERHVTPEQLDSQLDLINCLNGTINLRTGELQSHNRKDFFTHQSPYKFDPTAPRDEWIKFLLWAMQGSRPMVDYLQVALGYSMTGYAVERLVMCCHGGGANGKTTMLSTIKKVLGADYAISINIESLMSRFETNNGLADLARLRGKRFVTTSETEQGQRFAEGRLKRITQGQGEIVAARKYENPISFSESHTLWLDGNHRPEVRGTDNAIWDRLVLIPFDATVSTQDQDKFLGDKLMLEAEGILAWMVQGAVKWFADGRIGKPPEIERACNAWRSESDPISRFIAECCTLSEESECRSAALFHAYGEWCLQNGERPLSQKNFSGKLKARGIESRRVTQGVRLMGITLV